MKDFEIRIYGACIVCHDHSSILDWKMRARTRARMKARTWQKNDQARERPGAIVTARGGAVFWLTEDTTKKTAQYGGTKGGCPPPSMIVVLPGETLIFRTRDP